MKKKIDLRKYYLPILPLLIEDYNNQIECFKKDNIIQNKIIKVSLDSKLIKKCNKIISINNDNILMYSKLINEVNILIDQYYDKTIKY